MVTQALPWEICSNALLLFLRKKKNPNKNEGKLSPYSLLLIVLSGSPKEVTESSKHTNSTKSTKILSKCFQK